MTGGKFEAKFYMLRKSKDGVIVGFVVHPNDVSPELLALDVGDIVNIEWAVPDDEQTSSGIRAAPNAKASASVPCDTAAPQGGERTAAPSTDMEIPDCLRRAHV